MALVADSSRARSASTALEWITFDLYVGYHDPPEEPHPPPLHLGQELLFIQILFEGLLILEVFTIIKVHMKMERCLMDFLTPPPPNP